MKLGISLSHTLLLLLFWSIQKLVADQSDFTGKENSKFLHLNAREKRQIGSSLLTALKDFKWKLNDIGLKIDDFVIPKVQYATEKLRVDVGPSIRSTLKDLTNKVASSTASGFQRGAIFLSEAVAPAIEDRVIEISNAAVPIVNRGLDAVGTGLQMGVDVVSKQTSNSIEQIGQKVLGEQRQTRIKKIANNLSANFDNSINSLAGVIKKVTNNKGMTLANHDNDLWTNYRYPTHFKSFYDPNLHIPNTLYQYPSYFPNYYLETSTKMTIPQVLGEIVSKTAYSISNQILGPNLTEAVAPIARSVSNAIGQNLPAVALGKPDQEPKQPEKLRTCTRPGGHKGFCQDLSDCPELVLDLDNLRKSVCFKKLFRPGICCPDVGQFKLREVEQAEAALVAQTAFTPLSPIPLSPTQQGFLQAAIPAISGPLILAPGFVNGNQQVLLGSQLVSPSIVSSVPVEEELTTSSSSVTINEKMERENVIINKSFRNSQYKCGIPQVPQFRVVGGEESYIGEWPWTAAIYLHGPQKTEFWCGGSLISEEYVLTAAHCTKDSNEKTFDPDQFSVHLGDYQIFNSEDDKISLPQAYGVRHINPHPNFKRHGYFNDIALIKLNRKIEFNEYVLPVCLPPQSIERSSLDALVGQTPTVIGYGSTYYDGPQSHALRDVKLPIWKNSDCDRAFFQPITEIFLCAGYVDGGKDACQGDSGGPMVLYHEGRWIQLGIVSFGNRCAEPGYPGVYTRIPKFLRWIRDNLR